MCECRATGHWVVPMWGRVMGGTLKPELQFDNKINLCIVHGHLAFARFPVLLGHYNGDIFAGTEARLDRALDSRLSELRKMGLLFLS